jgi:hypothetical protein
MWKLGHLLHCADALQVNCDKFLGGMLCVYVCMCVVGWVGGFSKDIPRSVLAVMSLSPCV